MPGAVTAQSSGRAPTRGAPPFCSGLAGWRQRRAPATTAVLAPGARWKRGSTARTGDAFSSSAARGRPSPGAEASGGGEEAGRPARRVASRGHGSDTAPVADRGVALRQEGRGSLSLVGVQNSCWAGGCFSTFPWNVTCRLVSEKRRRPKRCCCRAKLCCLKNYPSGYLVWEQEIH
jgi:hypothetical protein